MANGLAMALADLSKIPQRAIIIAAGEGTRWNNYLGVDKHFIEIDGEPIIKRTVRLLRENGLTDIHVVGKDERYRIDGSNLYVPRLNPDNRGADKFLSSKELWLDKGRTIVLYGDVFFTDEAIETIVNYRHRDWLLFARPYGSNITGCPWGECFAQTFYEDHVPEHQRALERSVKLNKQGIIRNPGGWQHYRMMVGLPTEYLDRAFYGDRMVRIDDWTEDFDTRQDYETFMERWNAR